MGHQTGANQFEDENKPEITDEPKQPEIKEEELDRISGGGNSAWGTVQQGPGAGIGGSLG